MSRDAPPGPRRPTPASGADAAPRWAQRFVAIYLAAFAICGLAGIEAWPLTGWRLFSHLRSDRQQAWQAVTVDGGGAETPVPFARLPFAYRGYVHVLQGFPALSRGEKAAVCAAWAGAVRERGGEVAAVRIYRTGWSLSRRVGARAAPPSRAIRYECRGGEVSEVGSRAAP